MLSPSPISTILITGSQVWYVCVGLHLLSSLMLLYLILDYYCGCHGNHFYYVVIAQHPNITLIPTKYWIGSFSILLLIIVVVSLYTNLADLEEICVPPASDFSWPCLMDWECFFVTMSVRDIATFCYMFLLPIVRKQ